MCFILDSSQRSTYSIIEVQIWDPGLLWLADCIVSASALVSEISVSSSQNNSVYYNEGQIWKSRFLCCTSLLDIISRMKRSVRVRKKKGRGPSGCALRRVQLRVSDLGLGFKSQEEFMYTYCSGVCVNSLTNYDKIITSLAANEKTILSNSPPTACCRPIEYDDDLSFLDDNLIYHTMERHSARKCGCV